MPPRTIDNLGPETYTRYAEDQQAIDKSFIEESRSVYQTATMDVTKPFYPTQFNLMLGLSLLHPSWASFQPPTGYAEKKKALFTSQLLPFIGNEDKKEAQVRRVKERPKRPRERGKVVFERWQEEKEDEEEEREKEAVLNLFACIDAIDKDIIDINSRRMQFQKG